MKIIKLEKNIRSQVINEAVKILKAGGTIVYPTETAYGLGADFFNSKAIKKVYQIKGRNYKKPLSVIVSNLAMARKLVKFDKISLNLAKKHWPGPLTIILNAARPASQSEAGEFLISNQKRISNFETFVPSSGRGIKNSIPLSGTKLAISNYKTLGLRISSNKLATSLVSKLGQPITATSANVSGKGECYSAIEVIKQFKNKKHRPDLIIDAGKLPKRKVSTIVKVINNHIEILRKGKIVL